MMTWFAIALGAALGAPARFAVDRYFVRTRGTKLPYGTFVVNSIGSLILGFMTGLLLNLAAGQSAGWQFALNMIGTGFCGALTTFSGWTSQIFELSRKPLRATGTYYALASVVLGFGLATIGYALGMFVA